MISASREALKVRVLDRLSCIYYLVQFRKDKDKDILALLESGSEVNAMTPAYAAYLGFKVKIIIDRMQKINKSLLITYVIIIATF